MASVNKWIGIGNLGADPEQRTFASGDMVENASMACTSKWKDKTTGEQKEHTEWVRLVFNGRLAEIADLRGSPFQLSKYHLPREVM